MVSRNKLCEAAEGYAHKEASKIHVFARVYRFSEFTIPSSIPVFNRL